MLHYDHRNIQRRGIIGNYGLYLANSNKCIVQCVCCRCCCRIQRIKKKKTDMISTTQKQRSNKYSTFPDMIEDKNVIQHNTYNVQVLL